MAYRVVPLLGAYGRSPLLGASFSSLLISRMTNLQTPTSSTRLVVGPAPITPVSTPTQVVVPIGPSPAPMTIAPTVLPTAPNVPQMPGSSPAMPATGSGGNGAAAVTQPSEPPSAVAPELPGWLLPAAGAGLLLLFLMNH